MSLPDGFFTLHSDLPREGPGRPEDVARAARVSGLAGEVRIADLGCGPGADVAALLEAFPGGRVLAVDTHAPFIDAVRTRHAGDRRVRAMVADMASLEGPFDLIWCAGALYFHGLSDGLDILRRMLVPHGTVAVSYPALFVPEASDSIRAFWEGLPVETEAGVAAAFGRAGFSVIDQWRLSDAAWEAYHDPMRARISVLRALGDPAVAPALDEAVAEIDGWHALRRETGYTMIVARGP